MLSKVQWILQTIPLPSDREEKQLVEPVETGLGNPRWHWQSYSQSIRTVEVHRMKQPCSFMFPNSRSQSPKEPAGPVLFSSLLNGGGSNLILISHCRNTDLVLALHHHLSSAFQDITYLLTKGNFFFSTF